MWKFIIQMFPLFRCSLFRSPLYWLFSFDIWNSWVEQLWMAKDLQASSNQLFRPHAEKRGSQGHVDLWLRGWHHVGSGFCKFGRHESRVWKSQSLGSGIGTFGEDCSTAINGLLKQDLLTSIYARIAQLVVYRLGTGQVPGSNPGKGKNFSVKISNWIVRIWIWI